MLTEQRESLLPAAFFSSRIQAMHEYLDEAGLMQCECNVIGIAISHSMS